MPDINDIMRLKRNYDEFKDLSWDQLAKIAEISYDCSNLKKENIHIEDCYNGLQEDYEDLQEDYNNLTYEFDHNRDIIEQVIKYIDASDNKKDFKDIKDICKDYIKWR